MPASRHVRRERIGVTGYHRAAACDDLRAPAAMAERCANQILISLLSIRS
jgi:hypothetical protein